ncbi:hypothetical protein TNCT_691981 [Trichonephila clavata]|uniref:Uncharacterized protein n=1 Tax=Trichonephila clavata TaxID=2740835 RepID=A0A8X6I275_TRICU|nr:hypothetical protein TNCT_691981 [Trichonephila clavata]
MKCSWFSLQEGMSNLDIKTVPHLPSQKINRKYFRPAVMCLTMPRSLHVQATQRQKGPQLYPEENLKRRDMVKRDKNKI